MTDDALTDRIEELETRLMHLEATVDELTRTLLAQEQRARRQAEALAVLEQRLRALSERDPQTAPDPPPPHY